MLFMLLATPDYCATRDFSVRAAILDVPALGTNFIKTLGHLAPKQNLLPIKCPDKQKLIQAKVT